MISIFSKMSIKIKLILIISFLNVIVVSVAMYIRSRQIDTKFKEAMALRSQTITNIISYSIAGEIKLDTAVINRYTDSYSIDDETRLDPVILNRYADFIMQEPEVEYVVFFNKENKLTKIAGAYNKKEHQFRTDNIFDITDITDNVYDIYKEIIGRNNKRIGSIIIGFPMQGLKKNVRNDLLMGIFLWLGATVSVIILNFFSLTYFLKPIKDLYRGTIHLSKRDFKWRIPVTTGDEFGKISKQFNIMADELTSFYNELEKRVKEATTGLQEANKRLKEIDKRKSEFVATVSHDLRTPLTSILGFADTVLNKDLNLSEQEKEEYINIIRTESHRMSRLISDFLDISKIEEGKLQLNIEKANIIELINKTKESIDTKTKGINLSIEIEKNLPDIYLDEDRIRQVLQNLIGNALKYSSQNSEIKIVVKKYQKELQICVIDKGPGIADDKKKIIFEKFYREDDDIAQKERGSGLGLAIAKAIVEIHGGRIWVEDASPNGSCFTFTIPIQS